MSACKVIVILVLRISAAEVPHVPLCTIWASFKIGVAVKLWYIFPQYSASQMKPIDILRYQMLHFPGFQPVLNNVMRLSRKTFNHICSFILSWFFCKLLIAHAFRSFFLPFARTSWQHGVNTWPIVRYASGSADASTCKANEIVWRLDEFCEFFYFAGYLCRRIEFLLFWINSCWKWSKKNQFWSFL